MVRTFVDNRGNCGIIVAGFGKGCVARKRKQAHTHQSCCRHGASVRSLLRLWIQLSGVKPLGKQNQGRVGSGTGNPGHRLHRGSCSVFRLRPSSGLRMVGRPRRRDWNRGGLSTSSNGAPESARSERKRDVHSRP